MGSGVPSKVYLETVRWPRLLGRLADHDDGDVVVGRGEGLGRPLLYGVTRMFLEHFGLKDLSDLPAPDELPVVLGELQQAMEAELELSEDSETPAAQGEAEEEAT